MCSLICSYLKVLVRSCAWLLLTELPKCMPSYTILSFASVVHSGNDKLSMLNATSAPPLPYPPKRAIK